MDLILDTASDWLMVESEDCKTCDGNKYDIGPNLESGTAVLRLDKSSERYYGQAKLIGKEYTDTVCTLFSVCVENFEFFLIEES